MCLGEADIFKKNLLLFNMLKKMSFVIKLLVIIALSSGFPVVLPATCEKYYLHDILLFYTR